MSGLFLKGRLKRTGGDIKYGFLYNYYACIDSRNIAASGWHLPTEAEWTTLRTYLGGESVAGGHLKEVTTTYWISSTYADNSSGFTAKGGGYRYVSTFGGLRTTHFYYGYVNETTAIGPTLLYQDTTFSWNTYAGDSLRDNGFGVRLIKDDSTDPGTYTGNDGRIYNTVKIGNQVWLAEELAETKYRNGEYILIVESQDEWVLYPTSKMCAYNNNWNNVFMSFIINPSLLIRGRGTSKLFLRSRIPITSIKYGLLYNWYAVSGSDGNALSNVNWHVASKDDWEDVMLYYDSDGTHLSNTAGNEVKESGTTYWTTGNQGTNDSGLSLRGSGNRGTVTGECTALKASCDIWNYETMYSQGVATAVFYNTDYLQTSVGANIWTTDKKQGRAVRLVKDSTNLSHGQAGVYQGNDGKGYLTICIGTKEWITSNLAETKYRNGTSITEVTDNNTWMNLTTGAMCAYNNDWNNV